ncbi:hypothetical protein K9N68_27695 [Kovacikia minuta CCNUW1]|uniref:hypothetical protein n=1 Tax=Kovacikia minuta TaxID=2931930 RepID=UPI001CCE50B9|nr:hypothetical protein [Kovacikia minuta]UBF25353.1 hypothetical protein K9N68_27695 [Kovacikia minuta CCNUW1]
MKRFLVLKQTVLSFSLALSTIACGQLVAKAESMPVFDDIPSDLSNPVALEPQSAPAPTQIRDRRDLEPAYPKFPEEELIEEAETANANRSEREEPIQAAAAPTSSVSTPVPGTVDTSTMGLQAQVPTPSELVPPGTTVIPAATRYQFDYIGIGANFGTGSDSALGSISFAAFSKFTLGSYFSFRPAVLVEDDVSFLLPFTYDFPNRGPGTVSPYVGIGATFSTAKDHADLLLTAGLDYPLNPQLALTGSVNIAPINRFEIGFILGLAYTFSTRTITTPAVTVGEVIPPRPPRPNPSYFGVGVNLGAGGDSALGDISAAIYSKIALGSYISFRPAVLISSDATFLLPVTYDFPVISLSEYIRLAPYAGIGAAFSTGEDSNADLLLTAGVDIPLSPQFAATIGVNIGPFDKFDIGFLLGVAYTFGEFSR